MKSGWRTIRLGDVVVESREQVRVERGTTYPIAGVLIAGRGLFWREVLDGAATKYTALYRLREGQLVYRKLTAWEGPITVVPSGFDGAFVSPEFPTFALDQSEILPEFMSLICELPSLHDEMRTLSSGTAERRNRLAPADLLDIEIDLPPLVEQQRIVHAVKIVKEAAAAHGHYTRRAFMALHAAREEFLLTESYWQELPPRWELCKLVEVADIRSGVTKGRKTRGPLREAPFIRAANVQNGFLDLSEIRRLDISDDEQQRFGLAPHDILMTEGGNAEHVGRGWLWEGQEQGAVCQNHVFRVRVTRSNVLPRFLAYAIGASPARAYCSDSAKKTTNLASINKTQVSELAVPIPPVDMQVDIVRKLDVLRRIGVAELRLAAPLTRLQASMTEELIGGVRNAPDLLAVG